jgi:hypothetical protein
MRDAAYLEHVVDFADQLHVTVLDPIVNHFDVVSLKLKITVVSQLLVQECKKFGLIRTDPMGPR